MKNIMQNRTILILMIGILLLALPLSAQLKREGLIFSEVYLNEEEPGENWVEIYNPTLEPLILEAFRTYNVETINVLPEEINNKGGLEIAPGECVIICTDRNKLKYNGTARILQINTMGAIGDGGFLAIRTKSMGEDGVDIFRFGDPEKTSRLKEEVGDFVVPFSTENESYSRINIGASEELSTYGFEKTEPSPGIQTHEGGLK